MMSNFIKTVILVLLTAELFGCSSVASNHRTYLQENNIALYSQKLSEHNVHVFHQSNGVILVLPKKGFFIDGSANFTDAAYDVLELIFDLLSYYEESSIAITGYTRDIYDQGVSKALAVERAHRIMQYLWRAGVNSKFIYADGKKIPFNKNQNGKFLTGGVVIVMRKLSE